MKQSFLIPILPVILLPAPIKAFPSESNVETFSGDISSVAGRSKVALAPQTYESGAGLSLVGIW